MKEELKIIKTEEISTENNGNGWIALLGLGLGLGIVYGLCSLATGKDLNINIGGSPKYSRRTFFSFTREKTYYQRRREAFQRMYREKIFVTYEDIDEFHIRWKKKWVEEEFRNPKSYNRYYKLEDIF